jgi:dynein heavy chain
MQVDDLKAKLAIQEVELKQKNEDADKLIQVVGMETDKVSREKAIADKEEQKVALIMLEVQQKQKDCEEDLAKAEPALMAAQAALNTLNKVGGRYTVTTCFPRVGVGRAGQQTIVPERSEGKAERTKGELQLSLVYSFSKQT